MVKVSNKSKNRKDKFASHPRRAELNKIRRMVKHVKKHPNDEQTKGKL